ncbi:hypothetical protein [Neobacillus vireti]|uniref:hypothetical protein n=1 Tax=Neobacillus vireti TaxID=220686 RepID=UPI002FFE1D22
MIKTQRMIPDIVQEGENGLIVFDPKYRVPDNLGPALGEMHKYRDGILKRNNGERELFKRSISSHRQQMRWLKE